jgi:hypothetical protein
MPEAWNVNLHCAYFQFVRPHREIVMKPHAMVLIGIAMIAIAPANAQDRFNNSSTAHHDSAISAQAKQASHMTLRHRVTYKRNYKSDREEHQRTEELNRQFRGVSISNAY